MSKYYKEFCGKGKTYNELFDAVNACIKHEPMISDAVAILDYGMLSDHFNENDQINEESAVLCYVSTGGSEGVYVDCMIKSGDESPRHLATYKTLDEGLDAYIKMGMIAGAFTLLAEEYICANC